MKRYTCIALLLATALPAASAFADAPAPAPAKIPVQCTLDFETGSGHTGHFEYDRAFQPGTLGILVSEDFALGGEEVANLHVYFDGTFSSINVWHEKTGAYFNSDVAIGNGTSFSLFALPGGGPFRSVSVSCVVAK